MKTILVVDDEDSILRLIDRILSPLYRVEMCGCAPDGLLRLQELAGKVDLALVDATMSPMSGMRFIHTVKMSQPKLPMILMSGELQQPQTRAGTIPCDRFFHKPFLPQALLEVVEECLVPEFEFCD